MGMGEKRGAGREDGGRWGGRRLWGRSCRAECQARIPNPPGSPFAPPTQVWGLVPRGGGSRAPPPPPPPRWAPLLREQRAGGRRCFVLASRWRPPAPLRSVPRPLAARRAARRPGRCAPPSLPASPLAAPSSAARRPTRSAPCPTRYGPGGGGRPPGGGGGEVGRGGLGSVGASLGGIWDPRLLGGAGIHRAPCWGRWDPPSPLGDLGAADSPEALGAVSPIPEALGSAGSAPGRFGILRVPLGGAGMRSSFPEGSGSAGSLQGPGSALPPLPGGLWDPAPLRVAAPRGEGALRPPPPPPPSPPPRSFRRRCDES